MTRPRRSHLFMPGSNPRALEKARNLAADGLIISSPEYAHGVTGTIKNALDWLVGHIPFAYKPVAVFNPSYQSHHADAALKDVMKRMAGEHDKSRVTVCYLLAEKFGKLDLFV